MALEVEPGTTIEEVQLLLLAKEGLHPKSYRLIYQGRLLFDIFASLDECGIGKEAVLSLVVSTRGGAEPDTGPTHHFYSAGAVLSPAATRNYDFCSAARTPAPGQEANKSFSTHTGYFSNLKKDIASRKRSDN